MDLIDRHAAIDEIINLWADKPFGNPALVEIKDCIEKLPSIQSTLYGYDIEHLKLIANVLQKENLPPERITEVLTDIGRIVTIIIDEFEETLRKAVER